MAPEAIIVATIAAESLKPLRKVNASVRTTRTSVVASIGIKGAESVALGHQPEMLWSYPMLQWLAA